MTTTREAYPEVFRHFLNLQPSAHGNIVIHCPFHPDDTPSFSLDLNRGLFYCHGGGCPDPKGGGVITFVKKWRKIRDGQEVTSADVRREVEEIMHPITLTKKLIVKTPVPPLPEEKPPKREVEKTPVPPVPEKKPIVKTPVPPVGPDDA